ncbi:hypothetical protein KDI_32830 [Dictyobacter arantiisoli]|uniref:DUF676 domain-containing protein n=2 Tax=Dictyobacter arantiisoli TaxID=2014874 RepID=A0A5A5TFE4_9CHLR|nr:hypothetical protein KDI_32830 [Dictyobacter arantiisoli]
MPGCDTYWSDARSFLSSRWQGDFRQLTYYANEIKPNGSGCADNGNEHTYSANLQTQTYRNQCGNVGGGNSNAGTNNENMDHISCLLAWYLYYNFGQHGWAETLVGHSMGGLIVRRTLQLVRDHAAGFPTNIGNVTDAIIFNTPNIGEALATWGCAGCYQGHQMTTNSAFINDMITHGQAPSVSGYTTDWTVVTSSCDLLVADDPLYTAANHKVLYGSSYSQDFCYGHGGAIHDTSTIEDAIVQYCDTLNPLRTYPKTYKEETRSHC